jgi:glycerol-3-phosphate dehydrogenase
MKRDLSKLTNTEHDLVIIGGGIYGATAAWDASLRGLKVALIEKGDFGCQTSSNSLKIIHGGLRYIQNADYKRMRESIRERRVLMHIAPHLVHPLPCVMPTYGHLGKGPEALRVALLINDLVGFDRNRLDDPQKRLPNSSVISKKECLQLIPGIREENLTGAAVWHDCQVYNSERLLMSYLRSAGELGANLANYVQATGYVIDDHRVKGVKAMDRMSEDTLEIRSKLVLNTSGPWINETLKWLRPNQTQPEIKYSWAMNMVTKQLFSDYAAGVKGRRTNMENGRLVEKATKVYFVTPWRGYSLIGTIHEPYEGDPSEFRVTETKILQFMEEINYALPGNTLRREDIHFFYGGLLPMVRPDPNSGEVVLTKHYKIYDHKKSDGIDGVVSVLGVKYTTARDVAAKAIDLIMRLLNKSRGQTQTDSTRLFGGNIEGFDDFQQQALARLDHDFSVPVVNQLVRNYGSEYACILRYGEEDKQLLIPFDGTAVLPAEIIYAMREEMALHLADAVWRRTELGSAGNPGEEILRKVAELMARELGWDGDRVEEEVRLTQALYEPLLDA